MKRRLRPVACAAILAALALPLSARADVIGDWNLIAQNQTIPLRPTAHGQLRGMAMVQGAVYDAVNAIDRGHKPYLLNLRRVRVQPWASQDAAVATAAHHVLSAITPEAQHGALDTAYAATLAAIPDGPIETEGVHAGEAAASAMITARANDGFMAPFTPQIGSASGNWRPLGWPTAPAFDPDPWVANLKPFLIRSPSQFNSKGPNKLTSRAYTRDFNEVKELGSLTSTTRTPDQTTAAIFWQAAPIALYNRAFREISAGYHLDTADQARLYAMINLAAADGATSCWNDKYRWQFWRPMAAIREADTDGNAATVADPNWRPLFDPSTPTTPPLVTPAFPDHPSGHGCVSGSILYTARNFFRTDKVIFDINSSRFPGRPRHFERFTDALNEVIEARIWGGIHFRTADVEGAEIGRKVARWLRMHYFERTR